LTGEPVLCVVEIANGSRIKYEYDPRYDALRLDRALFSSVVYPMDYGRVAGSLAEDGSPLAAMICVAGPTLAGRRIWARPIALFRVAVAGGHEDTLLCVSTGDRRWNAVRDLGDLPSQLRDDIARTLSNGSEVRGWLDSDEALEVLAASRRRHAERA
jgi:inorganic pyrophosphatase